MGLVASLLRISWECGVSGALEMAQWDLLAGFGLTLGEHQLGPQGRIRFLSLPLPISQKTAVGGIPEHVGAPHPPEGLRGSWWRNPRKEGNS